MKQARRAPLEELDQAMDAKLRINTHQQMHLIGHHFQVFHGGLMLLADLAHHLFQPTIDAIDEYVAPIVGAPHDMRVARGVDVVLA